MPILKHLFIFALSCTLYQLTAFAHEDAADHTHDASVPQPRKAAAALIHKPSAVPDRIILTLTADPAHSMAVNWRTDPTVTRGLAQIGLADDGPQNADKAKTCLAATTLLHSDLNVAHYHGLTFEKLEPRTKYAYRVGDGVNWSEWLHFSTASDKPEPFAFIYFGDAQNEIKSHWSRVVREAYSDLPQARFMLHAGDLINNAHSDAEWGEWFAAGGWLNGMVPSFPTPGNHEYGRLPLLTESQLSDHWRPQFTLPENGPPSLAETVYYIDYQGARIISLNSNVQQKEQLPWLERVLSENPHPWTIIAFHHPIYSPARNRDNPQLRQLWQPIFDKYRVDLVLQGHDHSYARSRMLTAATPAQSSPATPLERVKQALQQAAKGSEKAPLSAPTAPEKKATPENLPSENATNEKLPAKQSPGDTPQLEAVPAATAEPQKKQHHDENSAPAEPVATKPAPRVPATVREPDSLEVPTINTATGQNYRSETGGTVYVVSVSGPKMYAQDEITPPYQQRIGENLQLYQLIHIDGQTLRFEARTARGELYDAFTLQKRDGANELIESQVAMPERRMLKVTPLPKPAPAIPPPAKPLEPEKGPAATVNEPAASPGAANNSSPETPAPNAATKVPAQAK